MLFSSLFEDVLSYPFEKDPYYYTFARGGPGLWFKIWTSNLKVVDLNLRRFSLYEYVNTFKPRV